MDPQDKTNNPEEKPTDEASPTRDPSEELAGAIDWDRDKSKSRSTVEAPPLQLAMAGGDEHRFPSPFKPKDANPDPAKPAEKPAEVARPAEPAKPVDSAKPTEKVGDPEFLKNFPAGAIDSTQRAYDALKTVVPGQALTKEQRAAFDQALADAGKLDPKFIQDNQQKLIEDVQSKNRVLPNGAVLPPWTLDKEKQFVDALRANQKAFSDMPESSRNTVARMEDNINKLPADDTIRRGVFQRLLDEEGKKDPKIKDYLDSKVKLDDFTRTNAEGLVRRNMHQQELSALHSKGVVAGIYAIALDRAGQPSDQKQLESLLKDSLSDRFAPANIPEIVALMDKYKLEEKETKELEDKVPGRTELRQALEIINDPKGGTAAERLEKAKPLFIKAIGSGDLTDQKKTNEEIEKISKERNELGDKASPEKMNELETKAIELVEKARLPYEARLKFAMALQEASIETKDQALNDQAVAMLRAAEGLDPANKLDPVIQGALDLAQRKPPETFDMKKAEEVGKPIVEKIKEEMIKAGKMPDDKPGWLKALMFGGEMLAGAAAFHLLGKYVFGPIGAAKNHLRRSWEASSRAKTVEAETNPSLKTGEQPVLMFRNKDGKEMPVEGVRKSDGRLRVFNGESTEFIKPGKGESLYMKVAPDSNLSKEQVRDLAAKKLTPTGDEQVINEERSRHKTEMEIRDREIEQLKKANEELQRKLNGTPSFVPTETERLNVSKAMLNADTVGRFHETVDQLSNTLKASPQDAGLRLREAAFDFLASEGIKDSMLDKERFDIEVSKEATKPSVEFSIGSGESRKQVLRHEGKFYLPDGKTEVPADRVNTRMVVPEGLIRGNSGELSRALYSTLIDQTNRGANSNAAQDRAGIHDFVSQTLGKHVPLSDQVGTATRAGASSALDQSRLPEAHAKIADLTISEHGIKLGGIDRDLSFVDIWSDRVREMKDNLKLEEEKAQKDSKKIEELRTAIASEQAFLEKLSNPSHPEHKVATERALELVKGFRASEGDIERLANERGSTGQVRGRLVALTLLVSAFIAWNEKHKQN